MPASPCPLIHQAVVVRDDVEAICREVRALSAAHDIVITAGGLGELGRRPGPPDTSCTAPGGGRV